MTRTCNHRIFDGLLVLLFHMLHKLCHAHAHALQCLAQLMVLIRHSLLKSCHQIVMLRWGLGCQNGWLDYCLQFPDYLSPRIRIGCNQSILNLLGNLCLFSLLLHFLPDPLDFCLQGNILCIRLCLGVDHCSHFGWWRRCFMR